jgi:hypothetical protein
MPKCKGQPNLKVAVISGVDGVGPTVFLIPLVIANNAIPDTIIFSLFGDNE